MTYGGEDGDGGVGNREGGKDRSRFVRCERVEVKVRVGRVSPLLSKYVSVMTRNVERGRRTLRRAALKRMYCKSELTWNVFQLSFWPRSYHLSISMFPIQRRRGTHIKD